MMTTQRTIGDYAMRATRAGCPALASWLTLTALMLPACIDERVSLGHHSPPLMPGDPMTGGQAAPALDASMTDSTPDAAPPSRGSPCEGSVYAASLRCVVDDFGMLPQGAERSMTTQAVLTLDPSPFGNPGERAAVRGDLAFEPWDLSFRARLAGELDCERGVLFAEIVDGRVEPLSLPGPETGFVGRIDAMLDNQTDTLDGMWFHARSMGSAACVGRWSASRQR
jgi:hypothetical protein